MVDDLLVVAPAGCYRNWSCVPQTDDEEPGELEKWLLPEERARVNVFTWKSGMGKRAQADLDVFLRYRGRKRRVLLMNVEALSNKGRAREVLLLFLQSRRCQWTIDESTCIMHWDSLRTEFVHVAAKHARYRTILTGLVAPETPMNVFSQFWFLDWRILGYRNFYTFRQRYAITKKVDYRPMEEREAKGNKKKVTVDLYYHRQSDKAWLVSRDRNAEEMWLPKKFCTRGDPRPGGIYPFTMSEWLAEDKDLVERTSRRGVEVIVSYRNQEELAQRVAAASYRVEKRDVLDLPPKIYMPIRWVEMTDEQERMYREMKAHATTELEGRHASAQIVLDQLGKLQALLCGHIMGEDGEVIDVPSNRVTSILELLEDHSGKAIIWAPYPRFLRKITAALQESYGEASTVTYWGETSDDERQEAKRRIQRDDSCRFIVANQSVGGEGNTWTAATLTIYGANGPKNKARQQSEDRNHRIGQHSSVTYVDLACPGTMDVKWINVIRKKMDLAGALTGDKWREWLV
jgi:hypothetical protein